MHDIILSSYSLPLVRDIGFMVDKEGVYYHPNRHMEHINVFVYVKKGAIHVIEDGKGYHIKEGTYLFLRKNVSHWGRETYAPGTEWYYIHFFDAPEVQERSEKQEYFNMLQQEMLIKRETYDTKLTLPKSGVPSHHEYLEVELQKLLDTYHSSVAIRPFRLSMLAYELFVGLYMDKREVKKNKKTNRIISQMIELLKKTPTVKLTSKEISEEIGMNYAYLSSLFREQTGKSVTQFQNELLIEQSIRLFNEESLNVSEVSNLLGFSNPFYFSRVFKKVTGISPSMYMEQNYKV